MCEAIYSVGFDMLSLSVSLQGHVNLSRRCTEMRDSSLNILPEFYNYFWNIFDVQGEGR